MKIRAFITHKEAEHYSDCQDRFSIKSNTKSVALADGMSQSYQQKIWAELLVDSYTSHLDFVPNKESIKELSKVWKEKVRQRIDELRSTSASEYLIIMNENALAMRKSAGATFLGLRFNGNKWTGDVLGDSCLIELDGCRINRICTSQPGDEFDNHPDYFDSDDLKDGKGTPLQIEGCLNEQTTIILVSDPFSDFLNGKKKEHNEDAFIKELLAVKSHKQYESLVESWRSNYGMHNDDSTLIIIEDDGDSNFNFNEEDIDDIESLITEEQKEVERKEIVKTPSVAHAQQKYEMEVTKIEDSQQTPVSSASSKITNQSAPILVDDFVQMLIKEWSKQRKHSNNLFKGLLPNENLDKELLRKVVNAVCKEYIIMKKK